MKQTQACPRISDSSVTAREILAAVLFPHLPKYKTPMRRRQPIEGETEQEMLSPRQMTMCNQHYLLRPLQSEEARMQ